MENRAKGTSITFTAIQNGAPVTGAFKTFTGVINFDPNQLGSNNVKIVVDVSSITDPYNQLSDTLKTQTGLMSNSFLKQFLNQKNLLKQEINLIRRKVV